MRDARQTGYTPVAQPGVTPEEVLTVTSRAVGCDGGGGALGHPRVWLRIETAIVKPKLFVALGATAALCSPMRPSSMLSIAWARSSTART